ncbi:hypothetical protein HMPREF9418_2601 [Neisseria macacae ATCC 33926]|uniref:Uncharacterized protein n=1 Tax=Neisseria macacae ATCC 33926 TaxID=997348 RepID=A0AA36XJ64_9NEIS|nr:hypothetical protein HMPREF9418_2601 [Neisseria macacae ATCC 33926]
MQKNLSGWVWVDVVDVSDDISRQGSSEKHSQCVENIIGVILPIIKSVCRFVRHT